MLPPNKTSSVSLQPFNDSVTKEIMLFRLVMELGPVTPPFTQEKSLVSSWFSVLIVRWPRKKFVVSGHTIILGKLLLPFGTPRVKGIFPLICLLFLWSFIPQFVVVIFFFNNRKLLLSGLCCIFLAYSFCCHMIKGTRKTVCIYPFLNVSFSWSLTAQVNGIFQYKHPPVFSSLIWQIIGLSSFTLRKLFAMLWQEHF